MPGGLAPALLSLLLAAGEAPAAPEPQAVTHFNVSAIALGVGAHDARGWSGGGQVGLRPELIFGRSTRESLGFGPFLEATAHLASRGVEGLFGGGLSLQVPLGRANAVVPSVGGYATWCEELGVQPGVSAGVFLGARQFNAATRWDGSWGLRLDARYGLGSAREIFLSLGVQVDLSLAVFLLDWLI